MAQLGLGYGYAAHANYASRSDMVSVQSDGEAMLIDR
jgi:hypothetical protein